MTEYKFNLQKSPVDPRDYMLEAIYPVQVDLPEVWDLRSQLPPVRDQGQQGSCMAQSSACMKEWQENVDIGFAEHMSPQFVYNNRPNKDSEGMVPRDAMQILNKIGIVPEKDYPYFTTSVVTPELLSKAAKYQIAGYAQVNTIDSLKKALYANGPCNIDFPVYDSNSMEFWKQQYPTQPFLGGHAVTAVGWVKDSFIIRNSWSEGWGDRGYTYYPFKDFGCHWEIWTAIDADSNPETLKDKIVTRTREEKKGLFAKLFRKKIKK